MILSNFFTALCNITFVFNLTRAIYNIDICAIYSESLFFQSLQTNGNIFVTNLAIANLVVNLVINPLSLTGSFHLKSELQIFNTAGVLV